MKRISLLALFLVITIQFFAQMIHPVVGTYKNKSAQGMAIWQNLAYLFNDGGHCRVVNLSTGDFVREFGFANSGFNPHVNCACFGIETNDGSKQPVIYISETDNPHRCFVMDVGGEKPKLLQIVEAREKAKYYPNHNWVVDKKRNYLYGINRRWNEYIDEEGNVENIITKYKLPLLIEGKQITLTEKDIVDRFVVVFANGMQDVTISDDYMYVAAGLHEMAQDKKGSKRAIIVIDLKEKAIRKYIDLSFVSTNEPEGIDFWKGKCLISFGQNGGIHQVKVK